MSSLSSKLAAAVCIVAVAVGLWQVAEAGEHIFNSRYDFGFVSQATEATGRIHIRNDSGRLWRLESITSECGPIVATCEAGAVESGEEASVHLLCCTDQLGLVERDVTLSFSMSGPDRKLTHVVTVTASIVPVARIEPPSLTREAIVGSSRPSAICLFPLSVDQDSVRVCSGQEFARLGDRKRFDTYWQAGVVVDSRSLPSVGSASIAIEYLSDGVLQQLDLPVLGAESDPGLAANPRSVILPLGTDTVLILAESPSRVTSVKCADEAVKAEVSPDGTAVFLSAVGPLTASRLAEVYFTVSERAGTGKVMVFLCRGS